jgi:hypothetical protein
MIHSISVWYIPENLLTQFIFCICYVPSLSQGLVTAVTHDLYISQKTAVPHEIIIGFYPFYVHKAGMLLTKVCVCLSINIQKCWFRWLYFTEVFKLQNVYLILKFDTDCAVEVIWFRTNCVLHMF